MRNTEETDNTASALKKLTVLLRIKSSVYKQLENNKGEYIVRC